MIGVTAYELLTRDVVLLMSDMTQQLSSFTQVSISSKTIPPPGRHDLKAAKTLPWYNHCVQKSFSLDRTESQRPHPRDIKSENFTNISINSDTI